MIVKWTHVNHNPSQEREHLQHSRMALVYPPSSQRSHCPDFFFKVHIQFLVFFILWLPINATLKILGEFFFGLNFV